MGGMGLEGADSTLGPQFKGLIVSGHAPFSPCGGELPPPFFSECVPVCLVCLCICVTTYVEVRENPSGVKHSYCEFWEANSNPGAALQALLSAEPAP